MNKFEKLFKIETNYEIGLPVSKHFFENSNLSYFYNVEIIDNNTIKIMFEGKSIKRYFDSKQDRDEFIKLLKLKVKEAHTFGKNKH
jgi:hypothetical protein